MKVLAIISSPLQLLNFKEYILKYNIKDYKLIVLSFVKKEQKQLLEAMKLLKIDKFILLTNQVSPILLFVIILQFKI